MEQSDEKAADRKKDHIELALESRTSLDVIDDRFYYDPLFSGHPDPSEFFQTFQFVGKSIKLPIWISSMTGGTEMAGTINKNLARACHDFGMGMGLGSCRQLLYSDEYFEDFNVRSIIGDEFPLYANLGIAQIEKLISENQTKKIETLIQKLEADGLIIHINPMQEWFQPEGDLIQDPPIDSIKRLLDTATYPLIVKEVGQGMGRFSMEALFQLPLAAIEFAAMGGTNFSKVELYRNHKKSELAKLALIGHSANEMVDFCNEILGGSLPIKCKQVIISGGVSDFLDGYYLTQKINTNSIYGQASAFLRHAQGDYETLYNFVKKQAEGLALAYSFLKVKR
ncbi:MAG: isopentenyl-diphosphate delta-isomerase [Bacteroidia bacterium]|nr:isopentenyl-diphosphate delta-isomerase [Bacteroidia bacterium]